MTNESFAFPPPPPPPPPPTYGGPTHSISNGIRGRGNFERRGLRGSSRGNHYRASRNNHPSYATQPLSFVGPQAGHNNGSLNGPGALGGPQFHYPQKFSANAPYSSDSRFTNITNHSTYQPQSHGSNHAQSAGSQPSPMWSHEQSSSQVGTDGHLPKPPSLRMSPPLRMGFGNEHEPSPQHGVPIESDGLHSQRSEDHLRRNTSSESHVVGFPDAVYGHYSAQQHLHNYRRGSRGAGYKWRCTDAFGHSQSRQKTQVAPPVPNFGHALPLKPPPQQHNTRPNGRKRKQNQLGLTPQQVDHDSSSEEVNVDEEVQFAPAADGCTLSPQQLQFTYKGRTATLQSESEIAVWIEERKKRFPTRAREAESRAKQQKAREEEEQRRKEQVRERTAQREAAVQTGKLKREESQDKTAKAKLRIEKLRKKLEKAERRAAKAEAKASGALLEQAPGHATQKKRKRSNSDVSLTNIKDEFEQPTVLMAKCGNQEKKASPEPKIKRDLCLEANDNTIRIKHESEEFSTQINPIPVPLTPTSQTEQLEPNIVPENAKLSPPADRVMNDVKLSIPNLEFSIHADGNKKDDNQLSRDGAALSSRLSTLSGDGSDDDDITSSSGSSSSSTDTGDQGALSSVQTAPIRVQPPKRKVGLRSRVCLQFLRSGACQRGDRCRNRHELPTRGNRALKQKAPRKRMRISLYQRLVEQEQQQEQQMEHQTEQQLGPGDKDRHALAGHL